MNRYLAQLEVNEVEIYSPLDGSIGSIGDLINVVISFLLPFAAVILFLILVWGGYDFLISRGEQEKVSSARAKITAAIIGFVLLVVSYLLVNIITYIFGLDSGIF
ncbi:MAG: hypothetical protein ACOCXQ_02295 [Patescibacteria group bacterium]